MHYFIILNAAKNLFFRSFANTQDDALYNSVKVMIHRRQTTDDRRLFPSGEELLHVVRTPVILIVEDNVKNLRLVNDILEWQGYKTLQALSGKEGIELARKEKPDLIVMDMQMPGIDGLEATRILKGEQGTSSIPIIALTAMAMKGDREIIMGAGCDGYLQKPIRHDVLIEAVNQFVTKKQNNGAIRK